MKRRHHWDTNKPEGCLVVVIGLVVFWVSIGLIVYFFFQGAAMKEDRRAMPSYLYEPPPLSPRRVFRPSVTLLVVWGFIALAAAFEIYAAIKLSPGFEQ